MIDKETGLAFQSSPSPDEGWPVWHPDWSHDPRTATREPVKDVTVYDMYEKSGRRLTWAEDGTVIKQEGDWQPGEVEALVSPEREEFSAWLERDGLKEER